MLSVVMRAIGAAVISAVGQGIIIYLKTIGVDLPTMASSAVADMISSGAANWFILAAIGLVAYWTLGRLERARRNPTAAGDGHTTPDLRASESADLRAISSSEEWKKLNALLHAGAVTAWSRTKGYKNLRTVRPNRWFNGALEFIDVGGKPETIIGDPHELRPTPWRKTPRNPTDMLDHDVHFNRAQLREHWPDKF